LFYRILNAISDVHIPHDVGDFRLMSRGVVNVLSAIPEQKPYVRGLVAWAGFQQKAILYDRDARKAGQSNYSLIRMISLGLDGITGFSIIPLRLITGIAFLAFVFSLLLIAYIFYGWIALDVVPGWVSMMSVVVFIGSVQMLALGVIGEYVGRCYMEAKRRPTSLIKQIYKSNDIKE
jgi:dolichol-phosphate mannosyltransferase